MKKKIMVLTLCAVLFALCLPAAAQQPTKIPRIGYLSGFGNLNNPGPPIEAFRQGLQELGYVEGKNILIEYRYIEGKTDRVPSFVAEMVQLKVDAMVIPHTGAIYEAKRVTKTIPIVMANVDPVANGIVDSLLTPAAISQGSPDSPGN